MTEIMEKGLSKHWTPGKELEFQERLKNCSTFAERHLVMLMRDLLKYNGRSKEVRRALAQARLRLASASDRDLKELAKLEADMQKKPGEIPGLARGFEVQRLIELVKERAKIKDEGISKEELRCR